MQPLIISQTSITPFEYPLIKSFSFAGHTITERTGFYLKLESTSGLSVQSEAAPLPGVSEENSRKTKHDLQEAQAVLKNLEIPLDKDLLEKFLKQHPFITTLCPSARFAIESGLFLLAAKALNVELSKFLEADLRKIPSAALLQGNYDQIMTDAKKLVSEECKVFKLKVGDRNIPLDVKKVNDLRAIIAKDAMIRLDANRIWSLKEALLFVELIGHQQIEFIEEPLSDIAKLNEFYQQTHFPVALDETLQTSRCGVTAPGRCSPTLAQHEAVKAYILKPMILGFIGSLQWIEEARSLGKKAIISSCFETKVGTDVLEQLACLTGQAPGLGTQRWIKYE